MKNHWLFLLLGSLVVPAMAYPQNPFFETYPCIGDPNNCMWRFEELVTNAEGNHFTVGNRSLVKLDPEGQIIWDILLRKHLFLSDITQTTDQKLLLTGVYLESLGGNQYKHHIYLGKFDYEGNPSWEELYEFGDGRSFDSFGMQVMASEQQHYFIATTSIFSASDRDLTVLKLDSSGKLMQNRTLKIPATSDRVHDAHVLPDESLVLLGVNAQTSLLLGLDASLDTVWEHEFEEDSDSLGSTWLYDIHPTEEGGYILVGSVGSFLEYVQRDISLIKVDALGIKQWSRRLDIKNGEFGLAIRPSADKGYVITGYGGFEDLTDDTGDIFLLKTDSQGDKQWVRAFGGSRGTDQGYGVKVLPQGYLLQGSIVRDIASEPVLFQTDLGGNIPRVGGPNLNDAAAQVFDFTPGQSTFGRSLVTMSNGNYLLAGNTNNPTSLLKNPIWAEVTPQGNIVWQNTWASSQEREVQVMKQSTDGNFLIAGNGSSILFGRDYFVFKVNAQGDTLWTRDIPASTNVIQDMLATPDGGCLLVGTLDKVFIDYNTFLVKLDAQGNVEWSRDYPGKRWEIARAVIETSDKHWLVVGSSRVPSNFDEGFYVYLSKFDQQGNQIWQKTYIEGQSSQAFSVCETPEGNFLLAGVSQDYFGAEQDLLLLEVDSQGNKIRSQIKDLYQNEQARSIQALGKDAYLLAGTIGYEALGPLEGYSFLMKIDLKGQEEWRKVFGKPGLRSEVLEIVQDPGSSQVRLLGTTELAWGQNRIQIVLTDTSQNQAPLPGLEAPSQLRASSNSPGAILLQWQDNSATEDGFILERALSAQFEQVQAFQVPANSQSYEDTGLNSETVYYYRIKAFQASQESPYSDWTSAQTQIPTNLPEEAISPRFVLSPNPVDQHLRINLGSEAGGVTQLKIYQLDGNLVTSHTLSKAETSLEVDVSNWSSGIYMLEFINKNRRSLRRLVIQ